MSCQVASHPSRLTHPKNVGSAQTPRHPAMSSVIREPTVWAGASPPSLEKMKVSGFWFDFFCHKHDTSYFKNQESRWFIIWEKTNVPVTTREFPSEREKGANQSADKSKLVDQFREPGPAQGPQLKRSHCRSPEWAETALSEQRRGPVLGAGDAPCSFGHRMLWRMCSF